MPIQTVCMDEVSRAIGEMQSGSGVYTLRDFLNETECNTIRNIIASYEPDKYGSIRCLLDKSAVFQKIAESQFLWDICQTLFNVEFRLSSFGARVIPPDGNSDPTHQHVLNPHIDHPYREVIGKNSGPQSIYYGIPLGLQVLIPLVDLTLESGATGYIPGSQKWYELANREKFSEHGAIERLITPAGSLSMWSGPLWHTAYPNQTNQNRVVITCLFSPAFMKHPHLSRGTYPDAFLNSCSERLKLLLGLFDPYPMTFRQPNLLTGHTNAQV